jgi:formyltetrahydrofolate-dependent phosphoribosylglycinamide formyltransferase
MFRVSVFVSGRGSNLRAVLNETSKNNNLEVNAVFSNKSTCPAFDIANEFEIPKYVVGTGDNSIPFEEVPALLEKIQTDLVVLAGFLKKIPDEFVDKFENRMINIHPALLPAFGGKGMYGSHVHKAVFDSSAQVSGATVHFVNKVYDAGKIIAQECVDISDVDSPEEIAERVIRIEHKLLPYVIRKISENKVKIQENRVKIL